MSNISNMSHMGDGNSMGSNQSVVYLSLLEKTLEKKDVILANLIELTQKQEILISNEQLEDDQFYTIIDDKDELIKQVNELDSGFEQLYQRVKDELKDNPESFRTQIEKLKSLITNVTDKGMKLEFLERHNKEKIDFYLKTKRNNIKNFNVNSKTVSSYYSSMSKVNTDGAYFFDKKK